jgi:hypothetical protein
VRQGIRTVAVVPPSRGDEVQWVCNLGLFVLLGVIYVVAFQTYGQGGATRDGSAGMLPYQVLFRDLPGAQQRVFRAMQEGTTEALRVRAESGTWPLQGSPSVAHSPPHSRRARP